MFKYVAYSVLFLCVGCCFAQEVKPCAPGPLTKYIAAGSKGCSIGDFTFRNLSYTALTNAPRAAHVYVSPFNGGVVVGLQFQGSVNNANFPFEIWTARPNSTVQFIVSVDVSSVGPYIQQLRNVWGGTFLPGWSLSLTQATCIGGAFDPKCQGQLVSEQGTWDQSIGDCSIQCDSSIGLFVPEGYQIGSVITQYSLTTDSTGSGQFAAGLYVQNDAPSSQ